MRVGYCRQSSKEQAICTNALNQQISRVESAGAQKIYCDIASGRIKDRKELLRLFRDIETGLITEVVVTRLDRLGRSVVGIQEALDLFLKFNINLIVLDGAVDIKSASGRGSVAIQAAVAQMEADLIGERIRNGNEYRRRNNYAFQPPFGYTIKDRRFVLHPKYSEIAREAIEKFLELKSLRATIKYLIDKYPSSRRKSGSNEKSYPCSPSGFRDWIVHPTLRGYTRYKTPNLILIPTHLEQTLIDDCSQEWQSIQNILSHGQKFRKPSLLYPLSGLVYCQCGASCYSREFGKYYQCYHPLCNNRKFVRSDYIELSLINALCDRAIDITNNIERDDKKIKVNPDIIKLEKQLEQLNLLGNNPAILNAIEDIKNQIARLKIPTQDEVLLSNDYRQYLEVFQTTDFWRQLTIDKKTTIYRDLVEKIVVGQVGIEKILLRF